VPRVYDNIIDSPYRTTKISSKNSNPHGTHIYERNIVESGKYICLKISLVMLYRIEIVNFSEYLPQQAPIAIVLLNFGSKLALCC